jgi:hypothetical protein
LTEADFKQVVSIVNGAISGPATLDVTFNLPAGTLVYFTANATNPAILSNFTISPPTDTARNVLPSEMRVDTAANDPFAGGIATGGSATIRRPTPPARRRSTRRCCASRPPRATRRIPTRCSRASSACCRTRRGLRRCRF